MRAALVHEREALGINSSYFPTPSGSQPFIPFAHTVLFWGPSQTLDCSRDGRLTDLYARGPLEKLMSVGKSGRWGPLKSALRGTWRARLSKRLPKSLLRGLRAARFEQRCVALDGAETHAEGASYLALFHPPYDGVSDLPLGLPSMSSYIRHALQGSITARSVGSRESEWILTRTCCTTSTRFGRHVHHPNSRRQNSRGSPRWRVRSASSSSRSLSALSQGRLRNLHHLQTALQKP